MEPQSHECYSFLSFKAEPLRIRFAVDVRWAVLANSIRFWKIDLHGTLIKVECEPLSNGCCRLCPQARQDKATRYYCLGWSCHGWDEYFPWLVVIESSVAWSKYLLETNLS